METAPPKRFSCAPASVLRDEPLAGTATHVRTWVLLEHSGPWGSDALLDARLPEGLGPALKQQAKAYRAKILLVRRARAKRDPERLNVFVADAHHRHPRVEHGTVTDLREVLDLDLTAFRDGGSTGLAAYDGALFCVCTNGRHDACCAELGRPVAMALDDAHPEEAWEVSHIGGDRFAGNLVVLPEGLYYGRLDPQRAIAVAGAHLAGEVDLDHLRGRSSYPMPVQAAEHHLRRQLGATRIADVQLVKRSADGDVTDATFAVAGGTYAVRVRTRVDPATATRLTCKAHRDNPIPSHELLSVERTG
ncbi:sucrase ferredoxin [Nocardioides antri]|uniref:Sucrase ferredoxin n=1 Tax=Nocardioides antri TaxID=2607659 RepID=A0A5B1M7B1_9ACTN|nr:sucrase ferredoxin [Nocardioides antri]KAA1428388.1 sucrase ferredoxin [Nocardioides antri]